MGFMTVIYIPDPGWTQQHEQYWWSITNPDGTPRPAYTALKGFCSTRDHASDAPLMRDRLVAAGPGRGRARRKGGPAAAGRDARGDNRASRAAEQGDFATNFALRAKRAVGPRGPNPMDIAGAISAMLAAGSAGVPGRRREPAPPGLPQLHAERRLGARAGQHDRCPKARATARCASGGGRRVQVEFVSANPTGPLHVGTGAQRGARRQPGARAGQGRLAGPARVLLQRRRRPDGALFAQRVGALPAGARPRRPSWPTTTTRASTSSSWPRRSCRSTATGSPTCPRSAPKRSARWPRGASWTGSRPTSIARACASTTGSPRRACIREGDFQRVLDLLRARGLVYEREGADVAAHRRSWATSATAC